jgi:O-antigen/teichoic acid export membrane protein
MSLKKNIISNLLLTASSVIISFVTFPYVTRALSTGNMGKVLFIDAFTQYFILFSSLGIPYYGVREIAKLKGDQEAQSRFVISLVGLQLLLAIVLSCAFLGISYFVTGLRENSGLVILGCLSILATSFSIEWFYQGIENFAYITKRSLIIRGISVLAIFIYVKNVNDHYLYYLILFLVIFLNAALNFGNYLFKFFKKYQGSIQIRKHLNPLLVLFSINVSISVYAILDTIILGLFTDPINVSYYSIPLKLVKIVWVVVGGFSVVLIPRISRYFTDNNMEEVSELLKKSLSIVFLLTIPFAFLSIFFSKDILFVVFGPKYLAAAMSLRILSVVPLIIGVCNVFGTQFLLPIGHEKKILHATIFGLVTSLALNFLLIPHLKFVGSCIACISAETVVCVYIYLKARKRIQVQFDYSLIKLILISSILSVTAGLLLSAYFSNLMLLALTGTVYALVFAVLQFAWFKNEFIYFLLRIKTPSQ